MMAAPTDGTALYGPFNLAMTPDAPAWGGRGGMLAARSVFRLFYSADIVDHDGLVDLTWALPAGANPLPIPELILAEVVLILDDGGAVAIAGTCNEAIDTALATLLPLLGGGNA